MSRINTNRLPYSNDFDKSKSFASVLFKPGLPVQIRELNQLQSILHLQTEKFADHIFKPGSLINGQPVSRMKCDFITLDSSLVVAEGDILIGSSGVTAKIILSAEATSSDPYTLYVNYLSSGFDNSSSKFAVDEKIVVNGKQATVLNSGVGDVWVVPEGVYYAFGRFIETKSSYVIGEKYTSETKSYKIGLDVIEDIVESDDDPSLLDNAINAPSYGASGADRLRIRLIPVLRSQNARDGDNFVLLASVEYGAVSYIKTKTEYSNIMDMLAERTYDESGNYTTKRFLVNLHEHLKVDGGNGLYTAEDGGDDSKFIATVSAGRAYIKGYQVEKTTESRVVLDKSKDLKVQKEFGAAIRETSYILIRPRGTLAPFPQIDRENVFNYIRVGLYDGDPGSNIGSFIPVDIEKMGTDTYRLYFVDLRLNTGKKFTDTQSIVYGTWTADPVDVPKIYSAENRELIWKIADSVRTTGGGSIIYATVRKQTRISLNSTGQGVFTRNLPTDEFVSYNKNKLFGGTISGSVFTPVDLESSLVMSPSQISINLGPSFANKELLLFYAVKKKLQIKTKTLKTISAVNQFLNVDKEIVLPYSDIYRLVSVIDENTDTDVTDNFTVFNGQSDAAYVPGVLTFIGPWTGHSYKITYEYFQHTAGNCFTIDSYTTEINAGRMTIADIPHYKSFVMKDCIDFRPLSLTGVEQTNLQFPLIGGAYTMNLGYYVPRIDLLVINKDGDIFQKKGIASDVPLVPVVDSDGSEMALYEIHQKAGASIVQEDIRIQYIDNKGYTMRDIGKLEQRLENAEYYTTFTLMEMELERASIKDSNGLDRFKNGFLADNFQNFQSADLVDQEFRAAHDRSEKTLRPSFGMYHATYEFDQANSFGVKKMGDVVIMDYDTEEFMVQPYATKNISVNPYYIFNKVGTLVMSPPFDNWADISKKPTTTTNITLSAMDSNNFAKNEYGSWKHVSASSVKTGEYITDVSLNTYMRSIVVQFVAKGLMPNTKMHCFFDGKNVSGDCRPLNVKSVYGDLVYSDENGVCVGEFRIPENTFFVGQKTFRLTNSSTDSDDPDMVQTSADCVFWAGGIRYEKQESTLNIITSLFTPPVTTPPPTTAPPVTTTPAVTNAARTPATTSAAQARRTRIRLGTPDDPIAQSFTVDDSCFITGVDVYFQVTAKDDVIWVDIRNMENGYPGTEVLSKRKFHTRDIVVSDDSSKPMHVEFDYPVYVEGGKEYCIVIGGGDPASRVWICRLGKSDIISGKLIDTQPHTGSFFKSQNNKTWDASQYEDMKFNLYRARFKSNTSKFVLSNKDLEDSEYVSNPFETEAGSKLVRVHSPGHSMVAGDKFRPFIGQKTWLNIKLKSGAISIGHTIKTPTGSAVVSDISKLEDGTTNVLLNKLYGHLLAGQEFKTDPIVLKMTDDYIMERVIGGTVDTGTDSGCTGVINYDFNMVLNGIPIGELNSELSVKSVDSVKSFIIETKTPATITGRTGGDVLINANKRYDSFNVSGSFISHGTTGSWNLIGTGSSVNGLFTEENYKKLDLLPIVLRDDHRLDTPYKFANRLNETITLGGERCHSLVGEFSSDNTLLSPMINVSSFSFIGIFNDIDYDSAATYNVAPNSIRYVDETDATGGTCSYKYVTRDIVLKDPARDIRIMVDVHKPQDSDFDIFVKTREPWNKDAFNKIQWVKVNGVWKDFTCVEEGEYREVEVTLGDVMPETFGTKEFTAFRIKIIGKAKNTAQPVLFKMLRAIAVT